MHNKIVHIGFLGQYTCYLNVKKDDAIKRYIKSEFNLGFEEIKDAKQFLQESYQGTITVKEIEFKDEFGTYEI